MSNVVVPGHQLWLPGVGVAPLSVRAASKAVKEYDAGLALGRHEQTGDWVVFIVDGPEGRPFPVFGLGRELPGADEIKRRLYLADTKRRGGKIVADIERRNDVKRAELRLKSDDAAGIAAEAFEWGHRQMGTHPNPRVFVPNSIPKKGATP